jgi:hypothetical protein
MTTVCCERAERQNLDNEELKYGYVIMDAIDQGVPHDVFVLNLVNMDRSAASIFTQAADVFGFNGTGGYAAWKLPECGTYYIFCQLTAADPRPLSLWTASGDDDSNDLISCGVIGKDVTGSWESDAVQWFHYGPWDLQGESLKFSSDSFWPHVRRFVLVPTVAGSPSLSSTKIDRLFSSEDAREVKLLKLSHTGVADKIASIPYRQLGSGVHFVAILRKPTRMSDNVSAGGSMIVVNGNHGFYEFEFINECFAEKVYLDVTYSSGDPRPIFVNINGRRTMDENLCSAVTGGYGCGDFIHERYGPYTILSEVNKIRITGSGFFPHVGEIRVVDARIESEMVTELSGGTWIVPPSCPMRQDLVDVLKDFCFIENTQEPNTGFEPDPDFYNGINCDGLWVLASKEVDKGVLKCAAELVCRYIPLELRRLCLQWRAPLGMPQGPFRLIILDHTTNQQAGDCPDFPDHLVGRNGTSNPGIFSSANDFSSSPGLNSACGELTVHEVTHGLDMVIRQQLDPYFFQEVDDCYQAALERSVYKKAYAAANRHEYLAEISTLFVGTHPCNFERGCSQCDDADFGICDWEPHQKFPPGRCGVPFRKKSDLIANDPMGYELLKSFLIEINDAENDSFWWE